MPKRTKVLSFERAARKAARVFLRLEQHQLTGCWGRIFSIRSDTWEYQLHDSVDEALAVNAKIKEEKRDRPVDLFFFVVGQSATPDLAHLLDPLRDTLVLDTMLTSKTRH